MTIDKFLKTTILIVAVSFMLGACKDDSDDVMIEEVEENEVIGEVIDDVDFEIPDWTTATHSNDADPNYEVVFSDNEVKRIDLVITSERWATMLSDMTGLYGAFGGSGGGPGGGGGAGGGGGSFAEENPVFVPGEVFLDGKEWYRVGIRFKGNSSLASSWKGGTMKLSFKLDFDEFEDDYPQIKNQRFYGFKKLSLKNNFDDLSQLREKVASDIFRNAGLASPRTSFYAVYVDHGDGPIYFGLYTMVEEIGDTVIETQFADGDGNLYEPDGDAASFANGSFDPDDFGKETNEDDSDWSDIEALFSALHDGTRTSDPASWRAKIDAVFDTDVFMKYLAVNTVIQNWDTYGRMTHNYYLYNNPDNGLLTWIPWDNNEALQNGKREGSLALDFSDLSSTEWPLIGYLYADETYKAKYDTYVQETIDGAFSPATMEATYTSTEALISSYATSEIDGYTFLRNSSDFGTAVNALKSHVTTRNSAATEYLK
ncbi:MAG: CotH kinase family protein [Cyclobacteriaceae bacterium]